MNSSCAETSTSHKEILNGVGDAANAEGLTALIEEEEWLKRSILDRITVSICLTLAMDLRSSYIFNLYSLVS